MVDLEDARRFHFSMPADMLDFNEDHSWFIYGSLSEIVNFNRGLMAGIWPVRDSLEAEFIGAAEKVKHEAEALPHAEAKKLLGDFTCRMCAKADETYRELRDALTIDAADVVLADAEAVEISVSDPNALVAITLTPAVESSELDLDPNSVLWSLGFSGKRNPFSPRPSPFHLQRMMTAAGRFPSVPMKSPAGQYRAASWTPTFAASSATAVLSHR